MLIVPCKSFHTILKSPNTETNRGIGYRTNVMEYLLGVRLRD